MDQNEKEVSIKTLSKAFEKLTQYNNQMTSENFLNLAKNC